MHACRPGPRAPVVGSRSRACCNGDQFELAIAPTMISLVYQINQMILQHGGRPSQAGATLGTRLPSLQQDRAGSTGQRLEAHSGSAHKMAEEDEESCDQDGQLERIHDQQEYEQTDKQPVTPSHQHQSKAFTDFSINAIMGSSPDSQCESPHRKWRPRPKKFQCPFCWVALSNTGQFRGHLRIHTGERPFRCDQPFCQKTFTRNEELTRHKRIHTGQRPYECELCQKRFGRKDHLKKHMRTHEKQTQKLVSCSASRLVDATTNASDKTRTKQSADEHSK